MKLKCCLTHFVIVSDKTIVKSKNKKRGVIEESCCWFSQKIKYRKHNTCNKVLL